MSCAIIWKYSHVFIRTYCHLFRVKNPWKLLHFLNSVLSSSILCFSVPESFLTSMGVASLDRFYGPVYKYQSHLAFLCSKLDPRAASGSPAKTLNPAHPLYQTPTRNINQLQPGYMQPGRDRVIVMLSNKGKCRLGGGSGIVGPRRCHLASLYPKLPVVVLQRPRMLLRLYIRPQSEISASLKLDV